MIEYYYKQQDKDIIYSIDMVRIKFELRDDCLSEINNYLENPIRTYIESFPRDIREFKFRYLYKINCNKTSIVLGLCFNGTKKEENKKGFIEFNPNKCMPYAKHDIVFILSRVLEKEVQRYDIAIDIPKDRDLVRIYKDKRKYELHSTSSLDRTEYLGIRNKVGRVKLYNKQIESKLEYPLTRLEMTVSDKIFELQDIFPKVTIENPQNELKYYYDLSETQKVLIESIRETGNYDYYLKKLDFRIRKKIEPYVNANEVRLKINKNLIIKIITELKKEFNI